RLLLKDGLVTLEDLDSANGTFLNGRRVKAPETVRPGDEIEVGPVTFVVEYELTTEALRRLRRGDDYEGLMAAEPINAVDGLAEGEVIDAEELPMLEVADDDEVLPVSEDELIDAEPVAAGEAEFVPVDFDVDAGGWQMPGGSELRELLSGVEDEDEPPTRHSPRR